MRVILTTWLFLFLIIYPDEKIKQQWEPDGKLSEKPCEREEKSKQPSERETLAKGKLAFAWLTVQIEQLPPSDQIQQFWLKRITRLTSLKILVKVLDYTFQRLNFQHCNWYKVEKLRSLSRLFDYFPSV